MGMFLITTSFVRRLTDTFSKGEGKGISPFLRGFAERKLIVEFVVHIIGKFYFRRMFIDFAMFMPD